MKSATERFSELKQVYAEASNTNLHAEWVFEKAKALHGNLDSRLCTVLDRENADVALKMIYAVPILLANHALFTPLQASLVNGLAAGYIWSAGEHVMGKRAKVNLLHAIALAAFTNINPRSFNTPVDALITVHASLTAITAALIAASTTDDVENRKEVQVV